MKKLLMLLVVVGSCFGQTVVDDVKLLKETMTLDVCFAPSFNLSTEGLGGEVSFMFNSDDTLNNFGILAGFVMHKSDVFNTEAYNQAVNEINNMITTDRKKRQLLAELEGKYNDDISHNIIYGGIELQAVKSLSYSLGIAGTSTEYDAGAGVFAGITFRPTYTSKGTVVLSFKQILLIHDKTYTPHTIIGIGRGIGNLK